MFDDENYLGTNTLVYRGCYFTSNTPGELFDVLALNGDSNLSVEVSEREMT